MKVSVPAPPGPVTGDFALVGPATEGAGRDVQERRGAADPDPLTARQAGWLHSEALSNAQEAMPELALQSVTELGAEGAPGQHGELALDAAEIAHEPSVRGSMQPTRTRDHAGVEVNAVHGLLPPALGCPVGEGALASTRPHWGTARHGPCVH